jgi:hypothetical protein
VEEVRYCGTLLFCFFCCSQLEKALGKAERIRDGIIVVGGRPAGKAVMGNGFQQ